MRLRRLLLVAVLALLASMISASAVAVDSARDPLSADTDNVKAACTDLFRLAAGGRVRTSPNPISIAVADFDRDGREDIAVAGEKGVDVLLDDRDGGFVEPASSPLRFLGAASLLASEFSGDGYVDLVVASFDRSLVTLMVGDGSGNFRAHEVSSLQNARLRAAADFNGDARADLIVTSSAPPPYSSRLHLLVGDGAGGFSDFSTGMPALVHGYSGVVADDIDRDGHVDLVVGALADFGELLAMHGDGAGGIRSVIDATDWNGPVGSIAIADFNRDGRRDLAVADWVPGQVSVLLGDRTGRFKELPRARRFVGPDVLGLIAHDFNGDGAPDLAVTSGYRGDIWVLLGDGRGRFSPAPGSPEQGGPDPGGAAAAGDFNADGRIDLVGQSGLSGELRVLLNTSGRMPGRRSQSIRFIRSSSARIARGESVTLSARLLCHPGRVALYRRRLAQSPTGPWKRIRVVATDYRGVARVTDRPRSSVEYQWRPARDDKAVRPSRRVVVRVFGLVPTP